MLKIEKKFDNPVIDLALDTISLKKQAIVFVNTKRSAEKSAEDIASKIKTNEYDELAEQALKALSSPTKQCKRLSKILKSGIAFHHAGLAAKQRELIEKNFKIGKIKVICSTPTLAIGLDLPAFRVIIRDLKRFTQRGLQYIPVLEYHQMAGRAGRPKYDNEGEAVCLASSEDIKDQIMEKYVNGLPEDIYSKLAVEPVLRTYVLSLVATRIVNSKESLIDFFSKTFWAYHYNDMIKLGFIVEKILDLLSKWGFIKMLENKNDDFVSADKLTKSAGKLLATPTGKRVAELYIDPLTAHNFLNCFKRAKEKELRDISLVQMVCNTLEMRPLLRTTTKDVEKVEEKILEYNDNIITHEPSYYDSEYQEFVNSFKTSLFVMDWISECNEEYLLETYNIRPGEIRAKLDNSDWLLYACSELAKVSAHKELISEINRLRVRIKNGVKEELIPLLRLKGVGRVRARKLFSNGIKDLGDVKKAGNSTLSFLLGKKLSKDIQEQVGIKVEEKKINSSLDSFQSDQEQS